MEVTLELVEQLRQHADVSFADAKAALEHTDGDLLEALIWLEQQGKIDLSGVGSYHTGPDAPNPMQSQWQPEGQPREENWGSRAWRFLTENRLECIRGEKRFEIPLAVLIALVLFAVLRLAVSLCRPPAGPQKRQRRDGPDRLCRRRSPGAAAPGVGKPQKQVIRN